LPFLYFLEGIRNPVLDFLFSIITVGGEETAFLAVGLIVFWCVGKYQGYYLLCTGFLGTITNQFLKMVFRIPRPWVLDPNFTIVESAREAATGYSFPSGHTQSSVGLFGGLARANKNRVIRTIGIALCILVPLSRMYLGVHTPADVGVSMVIATVLLFVGYPLFEKAKNSPKLMYTIFGVLALVCLSALCFFCFYNFPADVYSEENIANLNSAKKNGVTLLGSLVGLAVVYTFDRKYINFDTKAPILGQILKCVLGIGVVLAVKEGLKYPLNLIISNELISRGIRYFFVVLTAGLLWPLTFKFFARVGKKKENKE
jgi:undecaprenyl-diphosphatase